MPTLGGRPSIRKFEFHCPFCYNYFTTFEKKKKRKCNRCETLLFEGEDFKYKQISGFRRGFI